MRTLNPAAPRGSPTAKTTNDSTANGKTNTANSAHNRAGPANRHPMLE